ncbi:hypothetical protein VP01_1276g11 [Puccinia sorghi]|uniref:F-box domain-containing protein n=1 Tax=Puccinia sorghi TaxID=27349 RepID=A0A0L6VNW7_9BASI|nr:hypothetical protein VP01_1276g11 [Puccinia sorghi]
MAPFTPNDLPAEIVYKIISLSLGSRNVGKYVRKLLIALPTWEGTGADGIAERVAQCLPLLEGLEELEIKPPFDRFFSEEALHRLQGLAKLKKISIRRVSGYQIANVKDYFARSSLPHSEADQNTPPDLFHKMVLPASVEHLDLVQPSIEFMHALPTILKDVLAPLPAPDNQLPVASCRGLRSFSLQVTDWYNKLPNPNIYKTLPAIMSAKMTRFKLCLDTRLDEQQMIDLLGMTPFLEELKMGRVGLSQTLFRQLSPLKELRSMSLMAHRPAMDADINVEWLGFCDAVTGFIEKSPLLDAFEFDTALSIHTAFISLLLELLYVTTFDPSRSHSRLKHLTIKHTDPPPISSIERICERAPCLESLSIKVPVRTLERLRTALEKLSHLKRLELNNFLMFRKDTNPPGAPLDLDPFFRFTEQQNLKRDIQEVFTL